MRDILSAMYQVFDTSAAGKQGTDLVLVGCLGLPWLMGSGLNASKTTLPCPGAMVVWAQDDSRLHQVLYVTSEPLWI